MLTPEAKKNLKRCSVTILVAAALAACDPEPPKPSPLRVHNIALTVDQSDSTGVEFRCREVAARVAITIAKVKRLDVLVLGTGDTDTKLEPVVLVPWRRFELAVDLFEQQSAETQARGNFVREILTECEAGLRVRDTSPIVAAVARTVEALRAHCNDIETRGEMCASQQLTVLSDFRENRDRAVAERLGLVRVRRKPRELRTIDTSGIQLYLCGAAATRGERGGKPIPAEILRQTWGALLGRPDLQIDAACPHLSTHTEGTR